MVGIGKVQRARRQFAPRQNARGTEHHDDGARRLLTGWTLVLLRSPSQPRW